jgi:prophage regulatory protein
VCFVFDHSGESIRRFDSFFLSDYFIKLHSHAVAIARRLTFYMRLAMTTPLFSATTTLIRRPTVEQATGETRSTIYRKIQKGLFTRPVIIGGGKVAWPQNEVEKINRARIAGKTEDEIKELVAELHQARTAGQ